jgi:indolepyruvate ferredoxin oxidoreductase alpha subunit
VVLARPQAKSHVDAVRCIGCKRCIRELGCPAIALKDGKAIIDEAQCSGCTLCEQVCPVGAISGGERL